MEQATFGAGCFWGVEWVFRQVPGVVEAVSGYGGGHTENPTYRDVCSHTTGHAEVVRVVGRHVEHSAARGVRRPGRLEPQIGRAHV